MKSLVLALTLSLVSTNAMAMEKNCQGANNDDSVKGSSFTAQITQQSVEIKDGNEYSGNYAFAPKADTVAGKDGHTYLQYDWGGDEGCDTVLVDENLLKVKGQGWIKFRCRGEGFSDVKFECKP